jgi:sugar lactone lactonase YvrE
MTAWGDAALQWQGIEGACRVDEAELLIGAPGAELGEGPSWDEAEQCLRYVDIKGGRVHRWWHRTGRTATIEVGELVAAAMPRAAGGLVLALTGHLVASDLNGNLGRRQAIETGVPGNRLNDAKCDPAGRLYAGSMSTTGQTGAAALYRVDRDWQVSTVLTGTTISNGLGWSPDGSRMYFIDTSAHCVYAFDYDPEAGLATGQRVLHTFEPPDADPDGMTVDADGYLWVAGYGGGSVRRISPSGELDGVLRLPVSNVTSCAFGGPALDELFITTAADGLSESQRAEQPDAGRVFRYRPGVTGLPTIPFAG